MVSTLASLYRDLWPIIFQYLSGDDLVRLTLLTPALSATIHRSAPHLTINWKRGWVDLERCFGSASRFECIESLTISAFDACILPKSMLGPLKLASSLNSLTARFSASLHVFLLKTNLDQVTPNLSHLELHSTSDLPFSLSDGRKFPPKLNTLVLSHLDSRGASKLELRQDSIGLLPRSLATLELRGCVCQEDTISIADWMPGLTSLTLCGGHGSSLDPFNLPRTLSKLHLEIKIILNTRTGRHPELDFPWRLYFPRMQHLYIEPTMPRDALELALNLHWTPKDPEMATRLEALLKDSPPSDDLPTTPYRSLHIRTAYEEDLTSLDLMDRFLPQLRELTSLSIPKFKVGPSVHLKDLDTLYDPHGEYTDLNIPNRLTKLTSSRMFKLSLLPLSLTYLDADVHLEDTPSEIERASMPDSWPRLRYLKLSKPLRPKLASVLPTSIEHLDAQFGTGGLSVPLLRSDLSPFPYWGSTGLECDRTWAAMAKRLINLRHLVIRRSSGYPTKQMEPIASPYMESLKLTNMDIMRVLAWLTVLLDDAPGRPRILPPRLSFVPSSSIHHIHAATVSDEVHAGWRFGTSNPSCRVSYWHLRPLAPELPF